MMVQTRIDTDGETTWILLRLTIRCARSYFIQVLGLSK